MDWLAQLIAGDEPVLDVADRVGGSGCPGFGELGLVQRLEGAGRLAFAGLGDQRREQGKTRYPRALLGPFSITWEPTVTCVVLMLIVPSVSETSRAQAADLAAAQSQQAQQPHGAEPVGGGRGDEALHFVLVPGRPEWDLDKRSSGEFDLSCDHCGSTVARTGQRSWAVYHAPACPWLRRDPPFGAETAVAEAAEWN